MTKGETARTVALNLSAVEFSGSSLFGEDSHRVARGPKMVIASYRPLFEVIQMCLGGLYDAGSIIRL